MIQRGKNYLQEIQKFTSSQYWNSGLRITSGVMVPTLIMAHQGWLSEGMPFLFGALFVSLTDTPGPIHHRRNSMLMGTLINTIMVFLTGLLYDQPILLFSEVLIFSFVFSLFGIYGSRAGAVGTLALVITVIHMSPLRHDLDAGTNAILTAAGGLWYAMFSLVLYRFQPYRLVEQALGENLMLIGDYIRARSAFYKIDTDFDTCYNRVMNEQVAVLKAQNQLRELLFKTSQFVGGPNPKSRSLMMIFLESLDLFEEAMYSYHDYASMHKSIQAALLTKFYSTALLVVAELEHIGLSVQSGIPVKKMPALENALDELDTSVSGALENPKNQLEKQDLLALQDAAANIRGMTSRLRKIVRYTRMEAYDPDRFPDQDIEKPAASEPIKLSLLWENLTLQSNYFRYAIRTTAAIATGFGISALLSLSHAYWVMLTIITILKPVYNTTKKRNFQRVLGTLFGVLLGSGILFVVSNESVLVALMILSMLIAYSLLRVNYLGFVIFLTIYILITFHFLNPVEFKTLIGERLVDTLIGSVIAALSARFIFPVWQQYNMLPAMKKMLFTNADYFLASWMVLKNPDEHRKNYSTARNSAIVALTNLSDNFQQMLAEPGQSNNYSNIHQFVIASHTLTSRISALSAKDIPSGDETEKWIKKTTEALRQGTAYLEANEESQPLPPPRLSGQPSNTFHELSIIHSLARDVRNIAFKIRSVG